MTADKAKSFLSVSFAEPPTSSKVNSYDLLVCGSNGTVYKFRQGVCILAVSVSKGPVTCGHVIGGRYVIGGAFGQIKILDRHTFAIISTMSVHPSDIGTNTGGARPGTGFSDSGAGRPASAGGARPATASSSGGAGAVVSSRSPSMTRKARVVCNIKNADGKPAAAWGGPASGFVSDKCSQPLPPAEGVKASTSITGLAIVSGTYSSQVKTDKL